MTALLVCGAVFLGLLLVVLTWAAVCLGQVSDEDLATMARIDRDRRGER